MQKVALLLATLICVACSDQGLSGEHEGRALSEGQCREDGSGESCGQESLRSGDAFVQAAALAQKETIGMEEYEKREHDKSKKEELLGKAHELDDRSMEEIEHLENDGALNDGGANVGWWRRRRRSELASYENCVSRRRTEGYPFTRRRSSSMASVCTTATGRSGVASCSQCLTNMGCPSSGIPTTCDGYHLDDISDMWNYCNECRQTGCCDAKVGDCQANSAITTALEICEANAVLSFEQMDNASVAGLRKSTEEVEGSLERKSNVCNSLPWARAIDP